jgi:hypothetical protein
MRVWSARGEQRDHDAGPGTMNRGVTAVADVDGRASPDHSLDGAVLPAKWTLIAAGSRMSSAAGLVVVFVAFVCCAVWAAPAAATRSSRSAGVAPASQVVLGSSFRPIRATGAQASGDYLLFFPPSTAPMLINDRTGTTTALDPRCNDDVLGAPWVVLRCAANPYAPHDFELYSLAHGTRQTFTPSPGVPQQCSSPPPDPNDECAGLDGVGAYWIRWVGTCYHCADTYYFQNIQTGEFRDDPTNATTFADLNSPALAHKTCPGVRLMRLFEGYSNPWGSLTSYGQFALAIGTDSEGNGAFLERCGTRMRRLLAYGSSELEFSVPPLASNSRAIVWQTAPGRLDGLFLPSLQTFTIPLPSAIVAAEGVGQGDIALTSGALYLVGYGSVAGQTLWRTASPTALPLNTSRPTLTRRGSTLTCQPGRWRNAVRFSYAWRVNGMSKKGSKPRLAVGQALKRRSVSCSVTASNAAGTTTAASPQIHVP